MSLNDFLARWTALQKGTAQAKTRERVEDIADYLMDACDLELTDEQDEALVSALLDVFKAVACVSDFTLDDLTSVVAELVEEDE